MRLPHLSPRMILSSSTAAVDTALYSSVAPSSGAFIPATFDSAAAYVQVFVANEDGASVVSAALDAPCRPSEGAGAFYSGVMRKGDMFAVERAAGAAPLFFYSPNEYDCANGMVGALNPTAEASLSAFSAAARAFGDVGVAPPSSSGAYGGTLQALNPLLQAAESSPSVLPDPSASGAVFATTLHPGAVAGIAIGAVIALGFILGASWWLWSERTRRLRGGDDADVEGAADAADAAAAPTDAAAAPDAAAPAAAVAAAAAPTTTTSAVRPSVERGFSNSRAPSFADDDDDFDGSGDLADEKMAGTVRWTRAGADKVAIGTMSIRRSGSF